MLWFAMHGREYTPVALLIPTRAFLRTRDEERPSRTRRVLCLCDMQVERAGRYRVDRASISLDLFFFPSLRVSHRPSSLSPGNLVSFRRFLPSQSPEFESSFVIICAVYLTVHVQIVWLNPEQLQLRMRERIK